MPGVARLSDMDTGHGSWPPRPNCQASSTVFADNKGVHRKTDKWPPHCDPKGHCHPANTSTSSNTVFADNLGVARIGDSVSCGGKIAQGSSTVFAGD